MREYYIRRAKKGGSSIVVETRGLHSLGDFPFKRIQDRKYFKTDKGEKQALKEAKAWAREQVALSNFRSRLKISKDLAQVGE